MPELPAPCKKITKDYIAISDDIYPWFCEIYEKGDENTDLVYIDEMLQTLKLSPLYSQMSKKDQRDLTAKKFNEKVEKTSSCGSIIRHVVGVLMGNNEERRAHLGSENFR
jgi:abortive infection bacteriophage resistance protein